jgi:hypothetical protein
MPLTASATLPSSTHASHQVGPRACKTDWTAEVEQAMHVFSSITSASAASAQQQTLDHVPRLLSTAPARVAAAPAPSHTQHRAYAPHRVCHAAQQQTLNHVPLILLTAPACVAVAPAPCHTHMLTPPRMPLTASAQQQKSSHVPHMLSRAPARAAVAPAPSVTHTRHAPHCVCHAAKQQTFNHEPCLL